jgi:two-component system cell cycle sensor histidine kinase/response regulator CckA
MILAEPVELPESSSEEIAILAPTGRDAELTAAVLRRQGLSPRICPTMAWLCNTIIQGCGAVLIAEEALEAAEITRLIPLLEEQPAWSELPIILLTARGSQDSIHVPAFQARTSASLLERPVKSITLVSNVEAALRVRRRQYAARDQARQYLLLFERNPSPMLVCDAESLAILEVNSAALAHYGYSHDDFLRLDLPDLLPDRDDPSVGALRHQPYSPTGLPMRHRQEDGSTIEVEVLWQTVPWSGVFAKLILVHDITDRLQAEVRIRQAQKMEAVGRVAGGVAHEVNNMMAVVIGFAEFLKKGLGSDHPQAKDVEEILKAGARASGIVRQLLAFARRQVLSPTLLDVNAVVESTRDMLARLLGADIEFEIRATPRLPPVRADRGQLEQVLVNLALNARDAIQSHGRVLFETAVVTLDDGYAARHSPVAMVRGRYTMIAVSDNGPGMDPDILGRAFEPFFTTKPTGQGTGLGLSTVYGIVKQSDGYVWAYSEPGLGTTFKIYLPAVVAEIARDDTTTQSASAGTETILVVEDEPAVRNLSRRILEGRGYSVLEADDGRDALRLISEASRPIHLILCDVIMPEMNGRELALALQKRGLNIPLLYMSGYTGVDVIRRGLLTDQDPFVAKPFSEDILADEVRRLLDRRPENGQITLPDRMLIPTEQTP